MFRLDDEWCSPWAILVEAFGFVEIFYLQSYVLKIEDYILQPSECHFFLSLLVGILALFDEVAWEAEDAEASPWDGATFFVDVFSEWAELIIVSCLCQAVSWVTNWWPICCKVAIIPLNFFSRLSTSSILLLQRNLGFAKKVKGLFWVKPQNIKGSTELALPLKD